MNKIKNVTILKYGLTAVLVCFIVNAACYVWLHLDEPVFLKHFYEIDINGGSYIDMHYITNANDNRKITGISFDKIRGGVFVVNENNVYSGAHYKYNELMIEFRRVGEDYTEEGNEESVVLNKALIKYDNGDRQAVDIGKIVLHKNMGGYSFFDGSKSSSSNNFTSRTELKANRDCSIEGIESAFDEETEGFTEFTMNDVKADELKYPVRVKKGESLSFSCKFYYDSDDSRKYNVYGLQKIMIVSDSEGVKGRELIGNQDYYPAEILLNESGIIEYLKYVGVK